MTQTFTSETHYPQALCLSDDTSSIISIIQSWRGCRLIRATFHEAHSISQFHINRQSHGVYFFSFHIFNTLYCPIN